VTEVAGIGARTIRAVGLTFGTRRRRWFRRPRTLIVLAVVLAVGAGALFAIRRQSSGPPALPSGQVDAFLRAWGAGDGRTMASLLDRPPTTDLAVLATTLVDTAPGSRAHYTRTSLVRDPHGDGATATYHGHIDVAGFGPFDWNGTLAIARVKLAKQAVWRIVWQPSDLYPGLAAGRHLTLQLSWPPRASITAMDGSLLAGPRSVVTIGLEPDRIATTLGHIKQLLHTLVGTDPATIDAALRAPGVRPNYFVPVATVPDDDRYRTVLRPRLAPVPGVFFQHSRSVLPTSDLLGAQLIGSTGDITAERLHQLGPPYRVGDKVGLSGLQAAYETRLAGRPTGTVVIEAGTKVVRTVKEFPGRAAQPVVVTIDPAAQHAAESALAGVTLPAALVAIDASTGQIRAVVSKPGNGFERALDGAYPPGSTFKVITSTALLAAGSTGSTPAPCPSTLTVDGRPFKNFEGEASGTIDLAQAFKISCNNAFIGLADKLQSNALATAAASFGFGARWSLPVPSFGGSYPTPRDRAELAASAIGQGRVLASPVQMASVAAAVASGQWHAPVLTIEPASASLSVPALDPSIVATLRSFMASVVQPGGTAAGAGLPPGVIGKTGTAEFGNANPPQTHAWFIGYRGNLAFAVIVEGGGIGGQVAAPLAAKFLDALP
jgi:cell division protein FtsI/penicillin-binding protein 2